MGREHDSWIETLGVRIKNRFDLAFDGAKQVAGELIEDVGNVLFPDATPGAEPETPVSPAVNGSAPFSINASVGRGGANNPPDVTAVQSALNRRANAGLSVTGACDDATNKAIETFQKSLGQSKPDGRIDPGKATARALAGNAPLAASPTQPANAGPGQPASPSPTQPADSDEATGGAIKINFGSEANQSTVGNSSRRVIVDILAAAGETSCTITSTARTPEDQARAMYHNLENKGVASQKRLYAAAGDKVIDAYVASKAAGKSANQIQADMAAKIIEIGPAHVSLHCADSSTICVVDIGPSSIKNKAKFIAAVTANNRVSKFLQPPDDPAYHLEIPV